MHSISDSDWNRAVDSATAQFEGYWRNRKHLLLEGVQRRVAINDALQHAVGILQLRHAAAATQNRWPDDVPMWVIAIAKKPGSFPYSDPYVDGDKWQDFVGEHVIMMWDTFTPAHKVAIIMDAEGRFQDGLSQG